MRYCGRHFNIHYTRVVVCIHVMKHYFKYTLSTLSTLSIDYSLLITNQATNTIN